MGRTELNIGRRKGGDTIALLPEEDVMKKENMVHGGFLPLYTEIFPGRAVCCMTDLAITQIKSVYVLYAHYQS